MSLPGLRIRRFHEAIMARHGRAVGTAYRFPALAYRRAGGDRPISVSVAGGWRISHRLMLALSLSISGRSPQPRPVPGTMARPVAGMRPGFVTVRDRGAFHDFERLVRLYYPGFAARATAPQVPAAPWPAGGLPAVSGPPVLWPAAAAVPGATPGKSNPAYPMAALAVPVPGMSPPVGRAGDAYTYNNTLPEYARGRDALANRLQYRGYILRNILTRDWLSRSPRIRETVFRQAGGSGHADRTATRAPVPGSGRQSQPPVRDRSAVAGGMIPFRGEPMSAGYVPAQRPASTTVAVADMTVLRLAGPAGRKPAGEVRQMHPRGVGASGMPGLTYPGDGAPSRGTARVELRYEERQRFTQEVEAIRRMTVETKQEIERKVATLEAARDQELRRQPDLGRISDSVYGIIERRVRAERERRGA